MSARIETQNLTKRIGSCVAVDGVSLVFEPGRIHAVLGENGAGKSTLMRLLFGLLKPTEGRIFVDDKEVTWRNPMEAIERGLGMVQQHFQLVDTLSAIDNIMLGAEVVSGLGTLNRAKAISKLEETLPSQSLAVPWHTPVGQLSVGEKQRVEILKLLFRDSRVLFLDEPTAVLTPKEIEEFFDVLRKLKASGRTVVLITHKIAEVLSVCDTYTVLRQGKLIGRGEVKEASADSIVELMIGRKLPQFSPDRSPAGESWIFETRNLRGRETGRGSLKGVSLGVRAGEIVGIAGVDGSGQSRLVDSIMGLSDFVGEMTLLGRKMEPLQTGLVRGLGLGLVPEDRHHQGLWLEESCHLNMVIGLEDRFLKHHVFNRSEIVDQTEDWASRFDVRTSSLKVPVGALSGGNQQKVIFAREVEGRRPNFLICHQPTRGVDLGAIDLIHRKLVSLRNDGLGILLLSSELDELLKLCDRIIVFFEGKVSAEFTRTNFDRMKIGAAMTGVLA